jgi:hypothetical protein
MWGMVDIGVIIRPLMDADDFCTVRVGILAISSMEIPLLLSTQMMVSAQTLTLVSLYRCQRFCRKQFVWVTARTTHCVQSLTGIYTGWDGNYALNLALPYSRSARQKIPAFYGTKRFITLLTRPGSQRSCMALSVMLLCIIAGRSC